MSTVLTEFHNEKVRFKMSCCILHMVLLVVILLFLITDICHHYTKLRSKQKILAHQQHKNEE